MRTPPDTIVETTGPAKYSKPDSVIKARRILEKHFPTAYRKVLCGYEDCRHINELELSVIDARVSAMGYIWDLVKPFFLQFCNVSEVEPIPGEEKKPVEKPTRIRYSKEGRYNKPKGQ